MTNLTLKAARIQLAGLIFSVVLALVIAIGITTGAFILSFTVLKDLAVQGMVPVQWAWIFPAIIDGAIVGATVAVILLNKINGSEGGKRFFMWLLISVICISVVGNGFHAYRAAQEALRLVAAGVDVGTTPLAPAAAAAIAVTAPLLVLALTHGVGILIKAIGDAYRDYRRLVGGLEHFTEAEDAGSVAPVVELAAAAGVPVGVAAAVDVEVGAELGGAPMDQPHPPVEPQDASNAFNHALATPAADEAAQEAASAQEDAATPDVEAVDQEFAVDAAEASDSESTAPADAPEQTVEALLAFIAASDLSAEVKKVAQLRVLDPYLSYETLASLTNAASARVAMRRYRRAEQLAMSAGFTVPPLGDLSNGTAADNASEELASA